MIPGWGTMIPQDAWPKTKTKNPNCPSQGSLSPRMALPSCPFRLSLCLRATHGKCALRENVVKDFSHDGWGTITLGDGIPFVKGYMYVTERPIIETCLLSIMHVIFQCILKEINITSLNFARIFHEVSGNSLESCGFCGFLAKGRLLGLWKEDSGQN